MSWTNEFMESSAFKVKNTEEVKEVLNLMGMDTLVTEDNAICFYGDEVYFDEDTEVILSLKPIEIDGQKKNLLGLYGYNIMDSIDIDEVKEEYNLTEDDYMVVPITEYLQDQLADDKQYIAITTAGYEGRSAGNFNPFGELTVITKNGTDFVSLYSATQEILKKHNIIEE